MLKKKDDRLYNENSIISLEPREFTRLRPSTYLGSNEYSTQLVREIFANSLDEHNIGHGDIINVTIDTKLNKYCVKDNGQGFPINVVREDGKTVLEASFSVLNTSGKYDDNKDAIYRGSSLGVNGIGSKLTNFLSKELIVYSSDGSHFEEITFKDGIFVERVVGNKTENSGTSVIWYPDEQFFQNVESNRNDLEKLFEGISTLCPQLTINFIWNGVGITYHSENGIQDLLDNKIKNKEVLQNRFHIRKIDENNLFDIALTYTSDYSDTIIPYVNYGLTESGVHISTIKSLITKQLNKYATDIGVIKKEEDEFSSAELSEGQVLVFNLKTSNVKYDSQVKLRVTDCDRSLIRQVINNDFSVWLSNNPKDARMIIDRAIMARKARTAAQKAKDGIRNAKGNGKKFISLPTKLVDAYSKDRSECELYLVEGDSAGSGLIAKRDGKTQAIFPLRGKILSCRKATPDKIYANQEISNIVKALGLDIEKDTGKLIYDSKKLRYGKIILAEDADPDGYQIRLLIINMLWYLCPELLTNGHVYISVPPLYRITNKKNEYIYLIGDKELEEYKLKHKNESYIISRNKGLGESDPSELAEYLLRPTTRSIHQLTVNDAKEADDMLECFMGDKVQPRREYLLEHSTEVEIDTY